MLNVFGGQQFGAIYSTQTILFNLIFSFLLSLVIAVVYQKTHKGLSYSQAFVFTLILIGISVCSMIMVVGNNIAAAFGAFGVFSLIRFRTPVKEVRDLAYIFWVSASSAAVATNNHFIAIVTIILVSVVIFLLNKINFGAIRKYDYVLTFNVKVDNRFKQNAYRAIFDEYLKNYELLNINTLRGGKLMELSFSLRFFDENQRGEFVKKMDEVEGVSEINLIAAKNDIEY